MGDSVITIIAIFVAAILMLMWPLLAISERHEDVTQLAVQTATSELVDKVATSGLLKESDYDNYLNKLAATGNTYDVDIEVQHLDENPGKKSAITNPDAIGENVRYSTFGSTIIDNPNSTYVTKGAYQLKKGDIIIVTAKNNNTTIAQTLRNTFYKITGKGTYQVGASASSMIINTGNT